MENDYPYQVSKNLNCFYSETKAKLKVKSFYGVGSDEDTIAQVLMKHGPLAIAISDKLLHFYKKDVIRGDGCDGEPDHAVVLVGFGTYPNGLKYWIVKNSFGEEWG